MSIKENLERLKKEIPGHVKLIAVSKTMPVEAIQEAYNNGHRIFGENKAQELSRKQASLPKDIEWHMIGHLQSNKVKYITPFVHLIHSVDSLKLLKTIDKEARKNERIIDCFLQVHIAQEESKFGFTKDELTELLERDEHTALSGIRICGLMGMASFTDNMELVRDEFEHLTRLFKSIKKQYFTSDSHFKEISIGMSGDYKIAIECGATMVRIGTTIFGERNYNH
ncbi:MAG: YggS family pyridoxal phosphate-dependent enzyme [Bacteroidetes bacterium]|jgi:pyridoxal phosphate enzyme (YggS family)|nr:YggS family pyridoxal phosphate-dependent enzyme [Bacteroidota bacterium]